MASRAKPSTRENMVIELTAASDFNKFINVKFHNPTDFQDGQALAPPGKANKRRLV
ncbi:hypothetical protein FJMB80151_17910 [Enterobacter hormaechei]|jgi:hypothetical protein|uniref:Uncharacterized protein n=1 Tax=Enterobacter cloacae TaxID=550 RepID=A0ABD0BNW8_ENTCL|nr:hypothetical protein SL264_14120 [Enterobacter cloacae]BCZ61632.1 hypothetical protein SL269_14160 [Klebsiella aerogenes]BDK25138.1 hypothetical protein FJMB80063_18170 [Enterobacter hormaechei]BDK40478.1 hypothetical protein FJMB80145_17910 [Enterobacter hormaechei]BDK50893.1 hypothetical protein FJMB80151_17910 [Enterobacter hormaechei]